MRGGEPSEPDYPVDLTALQRLMPSNVYWSLGAPTTDEAVLATRTNLARERNQRFGRIEAGEASDEEIDAYFEGQRRLHQDYLDLCTRVLDVYGDELPERDRGLYELGANMHRDRLAELPKKRAEAIERRRAQEERRRAWGRSSPP